MKSEKKEKGVGRVSYWRPSETIGIGLMNHGNRLLRNNGRNNNEARVRSLVTIMFALVHGNGKKKQGGSRVRLCTRG